MTQFDEQSCGGCLLRVFQVANHHPLNLPQISYSPHDYHLPLDCSFALEA